MSRDELVRELETIENELEADEWPLAKQKKLRKERDRLEAMIRHGDNFDRFSPQK